MGHAYKALLRNAQARLSHSRRGECYDNAQAESLWSRLKTEELEARDWPVLPTWPTRRPASRIILTTTTTSAVTPALTIRNRINFINNLPLSPNSLLSN